jgi:hypothetical protein
MLGPNLEMQEINYTIADVLEADLIDLVPRRWLEFVSISKP